MKKFVGFLSVLVLFGGWVMAQQATIVGKWNVKVEVEGSGGHHFPSVVLELEQQGNKLIGNFLIPDHGDLPMEGEFGNGKLILRSTEDAFMKLDITGELKPNGQLAGTLTGTMGDHSWTAERTKTR